MANYNVDIAIALKNSNKLMQLRKELKSATENQIRFNKAAKEANGIAVVTFNKLNKVLSRARSNLDKAALGTASFRRSAKALVNVEKEHNKQLIEKEKLLNKLRIQADPNFIVREQRKLQIQENIRQLRTRKFGNVNPSRPADITFGQVGGKIGPAQLIDNRQGGFLAFSKAADKITNIGKDTKKIAVSTKKSSQILSQQATAAVFKDLPFGVRGGQIGPATPLTRAERMGFGRRASPSGPFAMQGGAMGRLKGGVGSALIGGGFPALFGAGGLSSILGGLAGGIGGALAPGGGFAASIFATAIAAEIEKVRQFRKAVRTLNEDLKNAGAVTQISRKEIKQLGRDLDITKEEATALVAQFSKFADVGGLNLARLFGSRDLFDATVGLNDFSSTLTRIQQISENLTLGQEFEAYKILSEEGSEAANDFIVNSLLAAKQADVFSDRFEEDLKRVRRLEQVAGFLRFDGVNPFADITMFSSEFQSVITQFAKENAEIQAILNDTSKPLAQRLKEIDAILIPMIQDTDLLKEALSKLPPEFDLSTEKAKQLVDALSANVENLMFLEEFKAPEEELKKLSKAQRVVLDLSKEIKTSFAESFKGIVKGTMTVTDAFRNMLNRIGDYFLDLAAQVLAAGIQKSFLGLFQNMFNIQMPSISGMADGGRVTGGRPYIVGERGPELFTPGVGGSITPNEALGGGSTNIVVNVDASGSNVEGDEDEGRALGIALSAAIETELIKQKRPGGLLA